MAKKRYKVDVLSPSSLNALKNDLTTYRDSLQSKCDEVARRLTENGVEIARANVVSLDAVFTGELFNSIHSEKRGSGIYVVVSDSSHAVFVEFGTGVIGKKSPYIGKFPEGVDWQYASGKTIRQLTDGRYGWFYQGNDGKWYFTEGMPSRPFMHFTAIELQKIVVKTVKEVFRNG